MAATHGPSGTLVGLAGVWAAGLIAPVELVTAAVAVVGCTAGAMLPDTDHPSSTSARLWGPLTRIPCRILNKAAGGHRAATHDVSRGAPLAFAVFIAAGMLVPHLRVVVVALLVGLAIAGVAPMLPGRRIEIARNPAANLVVSLVVAFAATPDGGWPLAVVAVAGAAVAAGVVAGIAGDACTWHGVPWRGRDRHVLPRRLRFRTGTAPEVWLVRPVVYAGVVGFAYLLVRA